ncbi:transmembrane protein 154 isoform X2 [Megalops cyprinoides]|uniref:transmembrane protein 154 isoform X2 n=1 Tax=Megalops cyprinoides TaxID=118141 RepID=UPI0018647578|nr:transmembrane protein 154 isoform X2 [Megalops cyprinoides]
MPTSDRTGGLSRNQKMTLLLLLVLTAGLAGRVHCEDEEEQAGDGEIQEESEITPTEEDGVPAGTSENDGNETVEDTTLSGSGELTPQLPGGPGGIGRSFDSTDEPMSTVEPTPNPEGDLSAAIIIVPFVLLLLIGVAAVAFFISRRRTKKQHASSDHMKDDEVFTSCDTEKVPMPMFEDDVPSVLELEMEDLEKWMIKDR